MHVQDADIGKKIKIFVCIFLNIIVVLTKFKTYLLVTQDHSNIDQIMLVCYVNCISHSLISGSKFCTSLQYESIILELFKY